MGGERKSRGKEEESQVGKEETAYVVRCQSGTPLKNARDEEEDYMSVDLKTKRPRVDKYELKDEKRCIC